MRINDLPKKSMGQRPKLKSPIQSKIIRKKIMNFSSYASCQEEHRHKITLT